jgi:hypothetical protein
MDVKSLHPAKPLRWCQGRQNNMKVTSEMYRETISLLHVSSTEGQSHI